MNQFLDNNLGDVQKRRLFNALITATVLLAIFLGVKSVYSIKEYSYIGRGTYANNVVTVNGTGEVFIVPDTGTFSFSVIESGKTVKEAQDKATVKINSILDEVKKMGIEEKDIKTTGYNSNPKYEYSYNACLSGYCPPGKQVLTGYEVSQTIDVKVRKTADAGDVLTKVGGLGATNISGLSFVVDDMEAVEAEARDKAIMDAKEKAKVLSKSLGVRLKKIINFYENGGQPGPYYAMDAMESKAFGGSVAQVPLPQVPVGENKVVSNVSITYEIE